MIHWLWWLAFNTILAQYMLRQCGVYSLEEWFVALAYWL